MRILDLFCGAGGFSYGFVPLSNDVHLAIDIDPYALETYRMNYPQAKTWNADIHDLHSVQVEEVLGGSPDIIIASPPCEEFSKANPSSQSPAAERIYGEGTAQLLLDTIRLIGDLAPKVFVIENVAAILQSGGEKIIRREFERVGVTEVVFNMVRAHRCGTPSKRLRVFISNLKLDLPRREPLTVMEAIGNLPSLGLDLLFCPQATCPNHSIYPLTDDRLKAVQRTRWGQGARYFRVSKTRALPNWVRLYPHRVSTSINGLSRYIHPYEDRVLSVREHARLMSYPDTFTFVGSIESQYNQVGESVPPLISHLIAQEVRTHLE